MSQLKASIDTNHFKPKKELLNKRSRSRFITYACVFLCPPYALYRLTRNDAPFTRTEKTAQVFVTCVYSIVLILEIVKG